MKIGWMGLGRLGLPCALQLAAWGHEVAGYDVRRAVTESVQKGEPPAGYVEPGVEELLTELGPESPRMVFDAADSIADVVSHADVVFVAVQTPHAETYDGTVPVPAETRDFEYGYLVQAVRDLQAAAVRADKQLIIVVVSTVLPGTTDRLLRPLIDDVTTRLVYSPQFIAMGTVIRDFTDPEFILLGGDDPATLRQVSDVFKTEAPRIVTSITNAEMIKVAYNTVISMKIVWANQLAGLCQATGADADAVLNALALSDRRVMGPAYMRPGMGDGGACHPRDLIALAHLEARSGLPSFYGRLALLRDEQSRQLAELVLRWIDQTGLEPYLLGRGYKADIGLEDGSPALLLAHQLRQLRPGLRVWTHDAAAPHPGELRLPMVEDPAVYVITACHASYREVTFPAGSVVIDPWGDAITPDQPGVVIIRPGRQ